jgi:Zn-dependent M16 (insulinase) family peptidase
MKDGETDIIMHDIETNQIAYLRYMFDISDLEESALPYLGLLKNLIGLLDTKNYTYAELFNEIHIRTGGMGVLTNFFQNYEEESNYKLTMDVKMKVLYGQMKPAYEIMKEMVLETDFSDVKRIKELLLEMKSKMQSSFVSAGHSLAAGRALSYFSVGGKISEEIKGLGQYRFIETLLENFDEKIDETISVMQELCQRIFVRERLIIDYTGTMEGLSEVKEISKEFYESLSYAKGQIKEVAPIRCTTLNEAFKTSGQVQFVCRAGNFKKKGLEYTGALKVLRVMMGYDYLWNNVRVKGGAYGCMSAFRRSGSCYFVSYRDPNLGKTVEIYEKVVDYLENFEAGEREMTQFIIGTLSGEDTPLTPSAKGNRSFMSYMSNIDEALLQKERDELLGTTKEDIRNLAGHMKAFLEQDCICVIGNSNAIENEKELFKHIEPLFR